MPAVNAVLAADAGARAARAAAASPGLVEQVTTQTRISGPHPWAILRDLNRERRIRRMRRVVVAAAEAAQHVQGKRVACVMVTLTYAPQVRWNSSHIAAFIDCVRKHLKRAGYAFRYQWVLELTKAGRVHYHALFWLPPGVMLPKPDQAGWWKHGMTRIERARRAVGYIVKYASKGCGNDQAIPKGARLFGVGVAADAAAGERLIAHRAGLAAWLREATAGRCARVRGGWLDKETGEVLRSPFRLDISRDAWGVWVVSVSKCEG